MGSEPVVSTKNLNHLGLVAATLRKNQVREKIDALFGKKSQVTGKVTLGQCVSAMILNGLGFANRALYLVSRFFEDKPMDILLGPGVNPGDLNDDALGDSLDLIAKYGPTRFFSNIAFPIAMELGQVGRFRWMDSTSFSVEGDYSDWDPEDENTPQLIKVTRGYSKQNRPDLKQVMMSMVMVGEAGIPIWAEPQDGNSSDKKSFHETRKRVEDFIGQFQTSNDACWVADSALYSKDRLLSGDSPGYWITRVPETIQLAKKLVSRPERRIKWRRIENGYRLFPMKSRFGGVEQRWILVYSQQAYDREVKTFNRKVEKEKKACEKALWHLSNEEFTCEADARKKFEGVTKKFRYHVAAATVISSNKYPRKGRPKPTDIPSKVYGIEFKIEPNQPAIRKAMRTKGRFIVATNDLSKKRLSDRKVLMEYKNLQRNEMGFRMLKDPWFLVDKIYLKTPDRVAALMSVMALTLLVYNGGQYTLRKRLKEKNETLPNQKGKEITNPTLRWVFQLMAGITVVILGQNGRGHRLVANLNSLRQKIVELFGPEAERIYGLEQRIKAGCGSG